MPVSRADATPLPPAARLAAAALPATERRRLDGDEVHLWFVPLPLAESALRQRAEAAPEQSERARAARLRFAADRQRQLQCRGVLRLLLASYLGQAPHAIEFTENEHGKPALADVADLHFNVSHCHDLALIGLTRRAPIGVDVEAIRALPGRSALISECLAADEQAWLARQPATAQQRDFFRLWSAKEALLKAIGSGLATAPASVAVALGEPGAPARVLSVAAEVGGADWSLFSDCSDGRHVVGVALRGLVPPANIRCFQLSEHADPLAGAAGRHH